MLVKYFSLLFWDHATFWKLDPTSPFVSLISLARVVIFSMSSTFRLSIENVSDFGKQLLFSRKTNDSFQINILFMLKFDQNCRCFLRRFMKFTQNLKFWISKYAGFFLSDSNVSWIHFNVGIWTNVGRWPGGCKNY